jgi:hypothetical protein
MESTHPSFRISTEARSRRSLHATRCERVRTPAPHPSLTLVPELSWPELPSAEELIPELGPEEFSEVRTRPEFPWAWERLDELRMTLVRSGERRVRRLFKSDSKKGIWGGKGADMPLHGFRVPAGQMPLAYRSSDGFAVFVPVGAVVEVRSKRRYRRIAPHRLKDSALGPYVELCRGQGVRFRAAGTLLLISVDAQPLWRTREARLGGALMFLSGLAWTAHALALLQGLFVK